MSKPNLNKIENVTRLDTRNQYEKSIQHMKDVLPYVVQEWEVKSQFLKKKYDRLIVDGFTEEQAMEIIKSRPIFE